MTKQTREILRECKRQYENCLYTAVAFTDYLKFLRVVRAVQVILSLGLGSFASWKVVTDSDDRDMLLAAAVAAFVAGLLPLLYTGLKVDDRIGDARRLSGAFTNLRDDFRQAAMIHSHKPAPDFEVHFLGLMDNLKPLRAEGVTTPQLFFWLAQRRIQRGDFTPEVDEPDVAADATGKAH